MRKMKDSGIEWIGEIPEEWEVRRSKYQLEIKSGDAIRNELLSDEGMYQVFGGGEIIGYTNEYNANENNLLIGRVGARCGCVTKPASNVFATDNALIVTSNDNRNFLYYVLISFDLNRLNTSNAQPLITASKVKNISIPFPPLSEQQQIADFLDCKCSEIDSVISKTRESIEEYKKLKQSIITEVVTGKVKIENGKVCGKYDTYKDSGIEWIGEIPSEWEVWKTLYTLKMPITDGPHETPELLPDGIPFISAEAVSCGNGHIDFSHKRGYISREYYNECCKKYVPQMDDIYMIKSGATTGKIAKVETTEIFTIWSPLAVFRFDEHIANVKYMFFYLQSDCYQKQIEDKWTFGTQQNIGMRTLEQLKLILPSLHEQQQISDFLDKKCSEIDTLIAKKEQLVVELEAYKKSLIYEVVTGKRSV